MYSLHISRALSLYHPLLQCCALWSLVSSTSPNLDLILLNSSRSLCSDWVTSLCTKIEEILLGLKPGLTSFLPLLSGIKVLNCLLNVCFICFIYSSNILLFFNRWRNPMLLTLLQPEMEISVDHSQNLFLSTTSLFFILIFNYIWERTILPAYL